MTSQLSIVVNGEARSVPMGRTVEDLLEELDLATERVAVERNRRIVRRADWDSTQIEDGDSFEIVHFVGGG